MSKIERRDFLKACGVGAASLPGVGSGVLLLAEEARTAPAPLSAQVKVHLGKPTLFINGKPVYAMLYALTDVPGGRWTWEEVPQHNLRAFADCGISVFQVDLFLEHAWMADGSISMDLAVKQVRGVSRRARTQR